MRIITGLTAGHMSSGEIRSRHVRHLSWVLPSDGNGRGRDGYGRSDHTLRKDLHEELERDEHGRYRSWGHCYKNFHDARDDSGADPRLSEPPSRLLPGKLGHVPRIVVPAAEGLPGTCSYCAGSAKRQVRPPCSTSRWRRHPQRAQPQAAGGPRQCHEKPLSRSTSDTHGHPRSRRF